MAKRRTDWKKRAYEATEKLQNVEENLKQFVEQLALIAGQLQVERGALKIIMDELSKGLHMDEIYEEGE